MYVFFFFFAVHRSISHIEERGNSFRIYVDYRHTLGCRNPN
ncbi:unnamed protein product [Nyctereutes procyonoides]|uniref:(raccoon dog) hypothetical protein n=1 Tax=Nyctereutes procyonoides TaxID=34880 RepID=A0A811YF10_NYCPR|nr:unnamed protein product [Nyctereutes procyonoides]